jgi:deoxycytidine triphosphate deaminase
MSVINLRHRLTTDLQEFERHKKSSDSLIYVDRPIEPGDGAASLDLTVGEGEFHGRTNAYYRIGDDGVSLKPGESCVVETAETISVPPNAFGLVTGIGKYIFWGVLVSSGKMDPGFYGQLRIGLYNGGDEAAQFRKGEPFCTVCFLDSDSSLDAARKKPDLRPPRLLPKLPFAERLRIFALREWGWILSVSIALASLIVAIISLRKR